MDEFDRRVLEKKSYVATFEERRYCRDYIRSRNSIKEEGQQHCEDQRTL